MSSPCFKFLSFLLLCPWLAVWAQPHAEWTVEAISPGTSPNGTSLAFAPDGSLWVSFRSINQDALLVSHRIGDQWSTTVVDSDPGAGSYSSLAIDGNGHPAVSYHDDSSNDLKLARFDGAQWQVETVDANGSVGTYTSLKFNALGHPVIAYESVTNNDLKLAEWNGSAWVITNVPIAGLIGAYASLDFTPEGEPAIAYFDSGTADLEYVVRAAGSWTMTSIDTSGNVGRYASLAFGQDGKPVIAYHDQSNGRLKLARFSGVSWALETVDDAGFVGSDISLKFAPSGHPAMSYYDIGNSALKYAFNDGNAWQKVTVTNDGSVGVFSSLAFSSNGEPSISFADSPTGVSLASHLPPTPVITWIGPADGLWEDAQNWSPRAPTTGDHVKILAGSTVNITSGILQVSQLTLEGELKISGGSLEVQSRTSGSGTLVVTGGTFEVTGGESSTLGNITLSGGSVMFESAVISSGGLHQSGGTLVIETSVIFTTSGEWSGGSWTGGGSLEMQDTLVISGLDSTHPVEGVQVITGGSVQWNQGDITLSEQASWTHEGGGDFVWSSGGSWTSGPSEVFQVQGRVLVQGEGATWLGQGQWMATGTLEINGHSLIVESGELRVEGSVLITTQGQLELTGGLLYIDGAQLSAQGIVEWSGGTLEIHSSSTVEVTSSGQWQMTGGQFISDGSSTTLINGEVTMEGGQWVCEEDIVVGDGGHIEVTSGEVIFTEDVEIQSGGTVTIEDSGTMTFVMSELIVEEDATLEGDGTIELNGGYYQTVDETTYLIMSDGSAIPMQRLPTCETGRYATPEGECLPFPGYQNGEVISTENYWVTNEFENTSLHDTERFIATSAEAPSVPRVRVKAGALVIDFIGDIAIGSSYAQVVGGDQFPPTMDVIFEKSVTIEVGGSGIHHAPRRLVWGANGRWDVRVRDPLAEEPPNNGIPGVDQIHTTTSLTLDATSAEPFIIALFTQDSLGEAGLLPVYDPSEAWSLPLVRGEVTGNLTHVHVDTSHWLNDRGYGHFGLALREDGLYLVHTPSPFYRWLAQHFTKTERAQSALISPTSDADGDGDTLLVEFFRQQNPHLADAIPWLSPSNLTPHNGGQALRIPLLSSPYRGLKVELQTSEDLAHWVTRGNLAPDGTFNPGASDTGNSSESISGGLEHVLDLDLVPTQFVRIKLTPADPWWTGPGLPDETP